MCGICGYISARPIDENKLREMTDTLTHRGPDDSGVWQYHDADSGYHIGFGHRRLSIFDLSGLGRQPMESADGNIVVTYNGEIYNFKELRTELEKEGYNFRSNCDTEVLVYAYEQWGDECISRFNGMFAIAIFDKRNHRAVFARDRMGKKPLYYYHKEQTLIFGSELKAIMKHPEFKKDINREMISAFLVNGYYHSPHTVFKDTYKLEPGCMMVWENGTVRVQKYWDLLEKHRECQTTLIHNAFEAKEGLKSCIQKSVGLRLAADVPVGVFLSGGIDSTLVAGTAAGLSDKPIKTFTIGFHEPKYNEADRAKAIANHLKTDHTELYLSEDDLFSMLYDIPLYYDEPLADSSQIPTMLVSKLARQDVTVALSGDGGDELFCGYTRYDNIRRRQKYDKVADIVKGAISLPGISKLHLDKLLPETARVYIYNRSPHTKTQIFKYYYEELTTRLVKSDSASSIFSIEGDIACADWQEKRMLLDMLTYLPDDILCKTDRASMRYALELRCPILDVDVVEYSFRIPMSLKYRNGEKKWLLKQAAYDMVPEKLLDMPKNGFAIPVEKWLNGPLCDTVDRFTGKETIEKQDIFNYEPLNMLVNTVRQSGKNSAMLWAVFMFQLWYRCYIEDLWQ